MSSPSRSDCVEQTPQNSSMFHHQDNPNPDSQSSKTLTLDSLDLDLDDADDLSAATEPGLAPSASKAGATSVYRRGWSKKKKKKRGPQKRRYTMSIKNIKKLEELIETLNPIPFVPAKSLDFASHENLLRGLGLWDFVHIEFDREIRSDLVAQLIANFSHSNRCSYVDEVKVMVNRADLARALKLPVKKTGNVEEAEVTEESIGFISEVVSNWVLLHDDTWMMPNEVLNWMKVIKDGNFEKVDWAGMVWFMVEKELMVAPHLADCYYAPHLQCLIKSQKKELLVSKGDKADDEVVEVEPPKVEVEVEEIEEVVGVEEIEEVVEVTKVEKMEVEEVVEVEVTKAEKAEKVEEEEVVEVEVEVEVEVKVKVKEVEDVLDAGGDVKISEADDDGANVEVSESGCDLEMHDTELSLGGKGKVVVEQVVELSLDGKESVVEEVVVEKVEEVVVEKVEEVVVEDVDEAVLKKVDDVVIDVVEVVVIENVDQDVVEKVDEDMVEKVDEEVTENENEGFQEEDEEEERVVDENLMDYGRKEENEEHDGWPFEQNNEGGESIFLRQCSFGVELDNKDFVLEGGRKHEEEEQEGEEEDDEDEEDDTTGQEEEGEEQEDIEDDEEEEEEEDEMEEDEHEEEQDGGLSLDGFPSEGLLHTMEATQMNLGPGMALRDPLAGEFLTPRDVPSLFGNESTSKRELSLENENHDDTHHHSLSKRPRIDGGSWDNGKFSSLSSLPSCDFDTCMDQIQLYAEKAKLLRAAKEQEVAVNQQIWMDEVHKRDEMIEQLHKARFEDQYRTQMEVRQLDRELHMMNHLLQNYRKALRETQKSFTEYRASNPRLPHDPLYKDVPGSSGLVISATELEKQRLKQEEEDRELRLAIEREVREFEFSWDERFSALSNSVDSLANKLLSLEEEMKLVKESRSAPKSSEPLESAEVCS